ncbi:MAG: YcaQ family DNA glycosylase [Fimbriimonadia bacterium]|nr:YcaQ family DNA glycosylase [Fimbriimonadia bacterium]
MITTTARALRRLLLHRQGLLEWQNANASGALWRSHLWGETGVLTAIERLGAVQLDPVAIVERNHHLALYNRVAGYQPTMLSALYREKVVFEERAHARCVFPLYDYPAFRWKAAFRKQRYGIEWESRCGEAMRAVAERLQHDYPLPARAMESDGKVSGYWDGANARTKDTTQAIEQLWEGGDLVVALRENEERFYALAEKWLPSEWFQHEPLSDLEARKRLLNHYIQALGVFDEGDPRLGWRSVGLSKPRDLLKQKVREGELLPVQVEGVQRLYYISAQDEPLLRELEKAEVTPHISWLPPLDNLLWRRERLEDLFRFQYRWEIYLPPAKRTFGAYALAILEGDQLIGRLDPRLDRKSGALHIQRFALEPGVSLTKERRKRLEKSAHSFADFHQAELELFEI